MAVSKDPRPYRRRKGLTEEGDKQMRHVKDVALPHSRPMNGVPTSALPVDEPARGAVTVEREE